jgi:hypothetical protein
MGGPHLILLILFILIYPNLSHLSQWSKFPDVPQSSPLTYPPRLAAASASSTSRPGGTVGWLSSLELALRVDNKETAVPSCTRTRSSSKATQMTWTGSTRRALKDHTRDATAKGQHLSFRRRTFARRLGLETTNRPACLLPVKHLMCPTPDSGRAREYDSEGALSPQGVPPTHGRYSRNGTSRRRRCHTRGLQINRDETTRLGDSDRRPPPDLPVFPIHRLSSMPRLKETGLGRVKGPQGAQSTHGDRSRNRTPRRGSCHLRARQTRLRLDA